MKQFYIIACAIILFTSCFQQKLNKDFSYTNFDVPPGVVQLMENYYVDAEEIRNIDYIEYMHWTKTVFKEESEEYKRILPDTNVWIKDKNLYNAPYVRYYLTHPAYRHYPVVGVTYEQAMAFCKWRGDRVMEFRLMKEGVMQQNKNMNKENYFTVERYFNGQFGAVNNNVYLTYYPEYTLMDTSMCLKIERFADSLNKEKLKHVKLQKEKAKELQCVCKTKIINNENADVTRPENFEGNKKKQLIVNLRGNLRELTSTETISFGGSYIDNCDSIYKKNFYKNTDANCYTGFRCVCKYKKWER